MIKLLLGGSPCTFWSIAQTNNRETTAEGMGWELFKNYLIAKDKFKPDYFLYENNKSAAQPIKDQISKELGVPLQYINSALVSAQNRQRFYAHNIPDVDMPADRGILLRDVLESGTYSINTTLDGKSQTLKAQYCNNNVLNFCCYSSTYGASGVAEPVNEDLVPSLTAQGGSQTKSCTVMSILKSDGKTQPIYEVRNGYITIKDKQYPIKLVDGYYIIRKLTVNECRRLQTIPDWYVMPCSASQNYKMLGNGWTVEVIKHILSHIPNIKNEEIEVLSMYDGMSCGQIALKDMDCNVIKYYATEIDKYAIQTTMNNFPNTVQLGDAFQVREENWKI